MAVRTSEGNGTAATPCAATKSVSSIICATRPFGPEWAQVQEDHEEGVEKDYEGESEIEALDEQGDVIAGLSAG